MLLLLKCVILQNLSSSCCVFEQEFYFRFDRKKHANYLSDDLVLADFSNVEINCFIDSILMLCEFYKIL